MSQKSNNLNSMLDNNDFLICNPEITFFNRTYRRHEDFSSPRQTYSRP